MKNILLALLLLCSISSFAKDREPAIDNGSYTLSAAWGIPNTRENTYRHGGNFGPVSITADRQLSKRFSVGLQYAYSHSVTGRVTFKETTFVKTNLNNAHYEQNSSYHSITAGAEFCYVNRDRLWMACGIAFGLEVPKHKVLYLIDSNNVDITNEFYFERTPILNYRLRFADVKYKLGKNLGLCASFGWGIDGILTFGVLYKFTGRK